MDFIGQGMKFPPQIDKNTGRFVVSRGAECLRESIYLILMTHIGERFLDSGFGSNIMSYTFMDPNATAINMLGRDIRRAILDNEPRIDDVSTDIENVASEGKLIINIFYKAADGYTDGSMVFPFYING